MTAPAGDGAFVPELADIPRATYRLQFSRQFGFADAERLLPYLVELGISHVYASPLLKARPGSLHGYDVVDHQSLNPEIGSEEAFDRYCARLRELGLGQVLDVVPNHMGITGDTNAWWLDVLENGQASAFASYFDIDWESGDEETRGRVLLPVLGEPFGQTLEAGQLRLAFAPERGEFSVHYGPHRFPIDPRDYPSILSVRKSDATAPREPDFELDTLLAAFERLPPRDAANAAAIDERRRDKEAFKQQLATLHQCLPGLRARVEAALRIFNGVEGRPESFDALDALLARQAYRLAWWRVGADEINYRRFFDVSELAALRIEREAVFEATHARILGWIAEGRASGLRIDHPDGLADPADYLARLQARYAELTRGRSGVPRHLYVVVEKILGDAESLPEDWQTHGDTGYGFAALCNQLFVDPAHEDRLSAIYRAFTGEARSFDEVLREAKHLVVSRLFGAELATLSRWLHDIARQSRHTRDFSRRSLCRAVRALAVAFPVYRSYIGANGVSDAGRWCIDDALAEAASGCDSHGRAALDFLREVLLYAARDSDDDHAVLARRFATRFQQFTAPLMGKAMEDTAFYRYHRLSSLNEVGSDPRSFGVAPEDFHLAIERLARSHPHGLRASSTHDSKRSEDVRARIDVLSEMPDAWRLALRKWARLNASHKVRNNRERAPSANDEYLLYQTLLGVWPLASPDAAERGALVERVAAFMLKAAREAKQHTSWLNPDPSYEDALVTFVRQILAPDSAFLAAFLPLQRLVARFGVYNSLNMLLLKLTVPGVPDIYQGCERWNFSLVDPDNRRPVDFDAARKLLQGLKEEFPRGADPAALRAMLAEPADGRIKLYLTWRALSLRRHFERTLRSGAYVPLHVEGAAAQHVVAFARDSGESCVVVLASRLLFELTGGDPSAVTAHHTWAGTLVRLPARNGPWREVFSGREVSASPGLELAQVLDPLPLALLAPGGGPDTEGDRS